MMEKTTTRALLLRALADLAEVRGQLAAINLQLQRQAEAGTALRAEPVPAVDETTQAELARIAAAGPNDLPSIITKQAQHDDGSPRRDADGNVILLHQDGTPLSVIERAIIARQAELRAAAGGG
jgi:hypothetical protein